MSALPVTTADDTHSQDEAPSGSNDRVRPRRRRRRHRNRRQGIRPEEAEAIYRELEQTTRRRSRQEDNDLYFAAREACAVGPDAFRDWYNVQLCRELLHVARRLRL